MKAGEDLKSRSRHVQRAATRLQKGGRNVQGSPESANERHVPVLLERCLELLDPAVAMSPTPVVIDATLGMGGHAAAMLQRFPSLRVIGLDRDPAALEIAGERLAQYGDRAVLVHAVYDQIPAVLEQMEIARVQGVLFDLGVSSVQLDEVQRGFSYAHDAPLDMRMDYTTGITAADVLNTYAVADIARVLREYGEERFAPRIASAIVRERERQPFTTSARLVDLVRSCIPAATRRTGGNPAKRTFQALRIEVNGELATLRRALPAAIEAIAVGGRVVVLSYQSLEDKITKQAFAEVATSEVPRGLPFIPEGMEPAYRVLSRSAEMADADEIARNPRSASVRLRAVERLRDAA
jgi:16S rRNA (cytosine1402-N4)-methyltransferase